MKQLEYGMYILRHDMPRIVLGRGMSVWIFKLVRFTINET